MVCRWPCVASKPKLCPRTEKLGAGAVTRPGDNVGRADAGGGWAVRLAARGEREGKKAASRQREVTIALQAPGRAIAVPRYTAPLREPGGQAKQRQAGSADLPKAELLVEGLGKENVEASSTVAAIPVMGVTRYWFPSFCCGSWGVAVSGQGRHGLVEAQRIVVGRAVPDYRPEQRISLRLRMWFHFILYYFLFVATFL